MTPGGLTMLRPTEGMHATLSAAVAHQHRPFAQANDGGSEGMARPDPMINFVELDVQKLSRAKERRANRTLPHDAFSRCSVSRLSAFQCPAQGSSSFAPRGRHEAFNILLHQI